MLIQENHGILMLYSKRYRYVVDYNAFLVTCQLHVFSSKYYMYNDMYIAMLGLLRYQYKDSSINTSDYPTDLSKANLITSFHSPPLQSQSVSHNSPLHSKSLPEANVTTYQALNPENRESRCFDYYIMMTPKGISTDQTDSDVSG